MLKSFDTILLDLHGTFMFDHDRFGDDQDYGKTFKHLGGTLPACEASVVLQSLYDDLAMRYCDVEYQECFPSVEEALHRLWPNWASHEADNELLVASFAHHECGKIPTEYAVTVKALAAQFRVGLVSDIWAPKTLWLEELDRVGLTDAFSYLSFSSDHGVVKPSPKAFHHTLQKIGANMNKTVVIGDSVTRDLCGAKAAGLPCILVGGASHPEALGSVRTLLDFCL